MPTVLIVEDQPSVADVVRYHLENSGFDVVTAGDVENAWQALVTKSPSAAVVDIKLPGADGWTFIERVRGDGRFRNLPAVVLTGLLEPEVVQKAAEYGCQYLSKPFAATALVNKVQQLLKQGVAEHSQGSQGPELGDRIDLVAHSVVLLLDRYQIEGTIHLPPELERFSDAWEALVRDVREFVPITDAKVRVIDNNTVAKAGFIQVRKAHIRAVFPQLES